MAAGYGTPPTLDDAPPPAPAAVPQSPAPQLCAAAPPINLDEQEFEIKKITKGRRSRSNRAFVPTFAYLGHRMEYRVVPVDKDEAKAIGVPKNLFIDEDMIEAPDLIVKYWKWCADHGFVRRQVYLDACAAYDIEPVSSP